MQAWFVELEVLAGVRHVDQRAFHGFRRRAVDILVKSGATRAQIQAAGNWASIQIPMDLYREGVTDLDRREAAAVLGKATSGKNAGTPAAERPSVEVSYPEADPDLPQLLKDKGLTDAEIDEFWNF